ncbi:MAG TPA: GMC family oxidoreductase [Cellvibrionaceae bacterium]
MIVKSQEHLKDHYDACVVGGGPGGMLAATLLAEKGLAVLLIERGDYTPQKDTVPFGAYELRDRYKNAGITAMLGAPTVNYVEGSCLGGGSEVNSGLYHRPSAQIIARWSQSHQIESLTYQELEPLMEINEKELEISYLPGEASKPSLQLAKGASAMGWQCLEVPRWFKYDNASTPERPLGVRRSATEVYLERFIAAGGSILLNTKVDLITLTPNGDWCCEINAKEMRKPVRSEYLFLSAGAIDTPFLLLKSRLGTNVGNSLAIHPTIKVMAKFPDAINSAGVGVPVHQVKEFAPEYSFGCAVSSLPFLVAQGMSRDDLTTREVVDEWQQFFTYYAMTSGGCGRIRKLPFFADPIVQYTLGQHDLKILAKATRDLCRLLLAAGASDLHVSDRSIGKISNNEHLINIPGVLNKRYAELMTIHVMGSCPMGEDRSVCTVDSWGRLHGLERIYVADASIFPGALGANPQGTLMALVRRNINKFLSEI